MFSVVGLSDKGWQRTVTTRGGRRLGTAPPSTAAVGPTGRNRAVVAVAGTGAGTGGASGHDRTDVCAIVRTPKPPGGRTPPCRRQLIDRSPGVICETHATMLLYAVRHAQVAIRPAVPPEEWHLSAEGVDAARALASEGGWEGVAALHHSPEPKTAETAAAIGAVLGVPLVPAPDLRELRMDAGFLGTDVFERRVGAYLEGAPDPAFEDYAAAQRRGLGCVRAAVAAAGGQPIAIVSHGRLLTAMFSALCGERLGTAAWRSIRMPDLSVVDVAAGRVARGFFAGRRVRTDLLVAGNSGAEGLGDSASAQVVPIPVHPE